MFTKGQARPAQFKVNFEQRIIEGYASTFGNVDEVGDIVVAGAFKKTLADRLPGRLIKSCYNHGPLIGSLREGTAEDSYGLFTVIKVSNSGLGTAVLQDASDGHLTHQSIAYDIKHRDYLQPDDPAAAAIRRLLAVKLYEAGPVDFPANELAAIIGAKQISEALEDATAAVPQLAELWARKGIFKDAQLDLHRHLTGVIATAIASAIKALSEGQPEPQAPPPDAATTTPPEPPPTTGESVTDPEATVYADIEAHLAALRMELSLASTRAAAH